MRYSVNYYNYDDGPSGKVVSGQRPYEEPRRCSPTHAKKSKPGWNAGRGAYGFDSATRRVRPEWTRTHVRSDGPEEVEQTIEAGDLVMLKGYKVRTAKSKRREISQKDRERHRVIREAKARMEVERLLKEVDREIMETKAEIRIARGEPASKAKAVPPLQRTVDRNTFYIIYRKAADINYAAAPSIRTWASGSRIAECVKDFIFDACSAEDDELEYESRAERLSSSAPTFSADRGQNFFLIQLGRCLSRPIVVESEWRKLMAVYEPCVWIHVIDVLEWVSSICAARKLQRWYRRFRPLLSQRREKSSYAAFGGHWAWSWSCAKLAVFLETSARVDATEVRAQHVTGKEFLRMVFDPAFKRQYHDIIHSAIHRTRAARIFAARRPPSRIEMVKRKQKKRRGGRKA